MMEIKTTKEIVLTEKIKFKVDIHGNILEAKPKINKKWVDVDDLMNLIKNQRDNGNLEGGGFSPALCLSKIIAELTKNMNEVKKNDNRRQMD